MSWQVTARQDARRMIDAPSVRILLALLFVASTLSGYVYPVVSQDPITTAHFPGFVTGWVTILVPLIGLILGYNTIVSERVSGSLLLSLSMPHSRWDLVVGKFLARAGVLAAGIVAGLLAAGWLVVYPFGELVLLPYLAFVGLTVVFGAIYTGIGMAISMVTSTKQRATVATFGVFFLFAVIWTELTNAIGFGLSAAGAIDEEVPAPLEFLLDAEPGTVYDRIVAGFIDPSRGIEGAWYLSEWIALLLFVLWAVAPLGLAYRRFVGVDL